MSYQYQISHIKPPEDKAATTSVLRASMQIPNPQFELYTGPCAWAKYRVATTVRHPDEVEATLPRDNKYALKPAVSLDRYLGVQIARKPT